MALKIKKRNGIGKVYQAWPLENTKSLAKYLTGFLIEVNEIIFSLEEVPQILRAVHLIWNSLISLLKKAIHYFLIYRGNQYCQTEPNLLALRYTYQ